MDPTPRAILTPTSTQCIYSVCMRTAGACTIVHWARKQPKLQAFGVKIVLTHDEGTAQLQGSRTALTMGEGVLTHRWWGWNTERKKQSSLIYGLAGR
jgi:hypothetical protein